METYVVLLRGINVGGSNRIKMAGLRSALESAGIDHPQTVLQTGNVLFESNASSGDVIDIVETTIESAFGHRIAAIVRTGPEIEALVEAAPWSEEHLEDPRMAHVGFCRGEPDRSGFESILEDFDGSEELSLGDNEVFVYYTDGSGRSKITNSLLEKRLKTQVTSRNWNTVLKIAGLLENG